MKRFFSVVCSWFARSEFTAPGGYRDIWRIAYPLILMNASLTVMQVADRIFLARKSTLEMSAAPVAGVLYFALFCFFTVMVNFTASIVAQLHGSGDKRGCVSAAWTGFYTGAALGAVMTLIVPFLGIWLINNHFGHRPELLRLECIYFLALTPCGLLQCMSMPLYAFFSGRGKTPIVALVNVIGCAINLWLNYLLIFGHWGFPAWGIKGAGIATSISMLLNFVIILGIFLLVNQREYPTRRLRRFHWEYVRKLFRFGTPAGLQVLFGFGSFNIILIALGRLGPVTLAASNIALAINGIVFMPLLGFSDATAIMTGNFLGQRRKTLANRSAYRSWRLGLIYMLCCVVLYFTIPEQLAALFSPAVDVVQDVDFDAVSALAVNLLMLMALFGISDTTIQVFCGALRGAGDTRAMLVISSTCASGNALLAMKLVDCGAAAETVWLFLTLVTFIEGVLILWRFRSGAWRKINLLAGHRREIGIKCEKNEKKSF